MPSRVTFTEDFHRYWLDGERVVSPTTALNVLAKHGLIYWAAKLGATWGAENAALRDVLGVERWLAVASKVPNEDRNAKGDRGRAVHDAALSLVQGITVEPVYEDGTPWPPDMVRLVELAAGFMDAHDVEPVAHECIVFSEQHLWAGRLDLVAELSDGKRWLLDYTTSSGVYPEKGLQLAAYRHASHIVAGEEDMPMIPVDATGVVWLKPDGSGWELIPTRSDERVYGYFLHALALSQWAAWKRDEMLGAPIVGTVPRPS